MMVSFVQGMGVVLRADFSQRPPQQWPAPLAGRIVCADAVEEMRAVFAERRGLRATFERMLDDYCRWHGDKAKRVLTAKWVEFARRNPASEAIRIALENLTLKHSRLLAMKSIPRILAELDGEVNRLLQMEKELDIPSFFVANGMRYGREEALACNARYNQLLARCFDEDVAKLAAVSTRPIEAAQTLSQIAKPLGESSPNRFLELLERVDGPIIEFWV